MPFRGIDIDIPENARIQHGGIIVAGGNLEGSAMHQLNSPQGLVLDAEQTIYVVDSSNNRIVQWIKGAEQGLRIAGGSAQESGTSYLSQPSDVALSKTGDSLIICDRGNKRVLQCPLRNTSIQITILSNVPCHGLTIDEDESLYLTDYEKAAVIQYQRGDTAGTVVAGGNGQGGSLEQLNDPRFIVIDRDHTLYVSDFGNHRVMKWIKGAREGIVVAGGNGHGDGLHQLLNPLGIVVDKLATVYISDSGNNRIMRWRKAAKSGTILIGTEQAQLRVPRCLSFDSHGNIYVTEGETHSVRRFHFTWTPPRAPTIRIRKNAVWQQIGNVVAGGNGQGSEQNQLNQPLAIFVNEEQSVYVADSENRRIMQWEPNKETGEVIAGGNRTENQANLLGTPTDIIVDNLTDSLIICDSTNSKVVRWPLRNDKDPTTIISDIHCYALTMDQSSFLYVTDIDNHSVRRYRSQDNKGILVVGGNGAGNRTDQLDRPMAIFVDNYNNIYVADTNNHRIMKYEQHRTHGIVVAGGNGIGGDLHQLSHPVGIVVDRSETIYILDQGNNRIIRWLKGNTAGNVFIHQETAQLKRPAALCFDRKGNLYVSDAKNHHVKRFDFVWTPLRGISIPLRQNVIWERIDASVTGGNSTRSALDQLHQPLGIFVDRNRSLYVVDCLNHRVVQWKFNGKRGLVVAGGQGMGSRLDQLREPTDIIVQEGNNSLFICDRGNSRVMRWSLESGNAGMTIIPNVTCWGLTMDHTAALYITDTDKDAVLRYEYPDFRPVVVAGGVGEGSRLDQLFDPSHVFLSAEHIVFVSDTKNHRVMKWTIPRAEGFIVAGGNGMGNARDQLYWPSGIVVDQLRNIYVVDTGNNRVMHWRIGEKAGTILMHGDKFDLIGPIAICFDNDGNLYVSDTGNDRVQRFSYLWTPPRSTRMHIPVNATWRQYGIHIAGQYNNRTTNDRLKQPGGILVDYQQRVFIVDSHNNRIVQCLWNGTQGETVAGGNGKGSNKNQLNFPTDVITDVTGDSLLICDQGNRRVVQWPLENSSGKTILSNIACSGLTIDKTAALYVTDVMEDAVLRFPNEDFQKTIVAGGKGKGTGLHQLNYPTYVFVDRDHAVYVSDTNNHRVMKWVEHAREGEIVAGGNGPGNNLNQLSQPIGIVVDEAKSVYICDLDNNRVVRWLSGEKVGQIVIRFETSQLKGPIYLSFDSRRGLFVADFVSNRVQRFDYVWTPPRATPMPIAKDSSWKKIGVTIAGGNSNGTANNMLNEPWGIVVDDERSLFVADRRNHRVVRWTRNTTEGETVTVGNGMGSGISQLNLPTDVITDVTGENLFICDRANRRIARWSLKKGSTVAMFISGVACLGLTMDDAARLYVTDTTNHAVLRLGTEDFHETVVAGGRESGDGLHQLNYPTYVFVDRDHAVYVSDTDNHRVMKWVEHAREGEIVAGGNGPGDNLNQLGQPLGIVVDESKSLFVCDCTSSRVVRWLPGEKVGQIVIDFDSSHLRMPVSLSFDNHGNLYVSNAGNHQVQRFSYLWKPPRSTLMHIPVNASWKRMGVNIAGEDSNGTATNKLNQPTGIVVDHQQRVFIVDSYNNRIVQCMWNGSEGKAIANGSGIGNNANRFGNVLDLITDATDDNLFICDREGAKVVRWPLENNSSGKTILSNINCLGLTIDKTAALYVTDTMEDAVLRFANEDFQKTIVAGGKGKGTGLHQLNYPTYVFVDRDHAVYVSDTDNHRVMKWLEHAREGEIVAGGNGPGNNLNQLSRPLGIVVDEVKSVYICDVDNNRVVRWLSGEKVGQIVIDFDSSHLRMPVSLSFDNHGNLYVSDAGNHRVQRYDRSWI